jgi:hypothetical protein
MALAALFVLACGPSVSADAPVVTYYYVPG